MSPQYEQSPLDPAFAQLMQTTQQQDIKALQEKLQGDSASLLARYGARQQFAASGGMSAPMVSLS